MADDEARFKLNQNDGVDTLHVEHPWEECNYDEAVGGSEIDAATARSMLSSGAAVACEHCKPEPVA